MYREKRETLLAAFMEIQNYAIFRQERIEKQMAVETVDPQASGLYAVSQQLPRDLFQMEVLYNVGRAFHQVREYAESNA